MRTTLSGQLLDQAHRLATHRGKPQQANLRRAVSAAYYGLFHLLVDAATTHLFQGSDPLFARLRVTFYRSLDHGPMKEVSSLFAGKKSDWPPWLGPLMGHGSGSAGAGGASHGVAPPTASIPAEVKDLAVAFVELQDARHQADYAPGPGPRQQEALKFVQQARSAEQGWRLIRSHPVARLFVYALALRALDKFQKTPSK